MIDNSGFESIFRHEWSRLVATLVRDLGDLDIAEDAAQDAFMEASTRWPDSGLPDRPGAWLLTVARRKSIDRARQSNRSAARQQKLVDNARWAEQSASPALVDDQLALLLGCCHPALNLDAQVALTLRVVAGLTTEQIARAFLVTEPTMVRRITRAKTKIRMAGIPFIVPDREVLTTRINSISQVVYLIFTEGHSSASSTKLIRGDLCDEALWLSDLLVKLVPNDPEVLGLAALIQLTDSRRQARTDDDGAPVLLEDQDRGRWNRQQIEHGLRLIAEAHALGQLGPFQIQASIQALHCAAPQFADTDWVRIVTLYDLLILRQPSAVVALNRAAALSHIEGPEAALATLVGLEEALDGYIHFHVARAELLSQAGRSREADEAYERAIGQSTNQAEQKHLQRRRQRLVGLPTRTDRATGSSDSD